MNLINSLLRQNLKLSDVPFKQINEGFRRCFTDFQTREWQLAGPELKWFEAELMNLKQWDKNSGDI